MTTIPAEPSDEVLAQQTQQGNTEMFGVLVERYEQKLSRYGRKFLSNKEDMQDLVQDIFLKSYENIQSFDPSYRFSSWIYRIAHNTFVNHLKKRSRNPLLFVDFDTFLGHPAYEDPSESDRERKETKELFLACLDKLPLKYREVLVLYYSEGMAYKEIADILEIPQGTVGVRVKRGKAALEKACADMNIKR